jgi:hypothetical protein
MVASLDSAFGSSLSASAPAVASSGLDGGFTIGRRAGTVSTSNKASSQQMAPPPMQAGTSITDAPGAVGAPTASAAAGGAGAAGLMGSGSSFTYPITTEEKLHTLTQELQRQKDYLEQQRLGYFDRLMSRRREVMKLIMFCLIILLAMSIHTNVKHYYRVFFDTNVVTGHKEVLIRLAYPAIILFALWNSRIFVRA